MRSHPEALPVLSCEEALRHEHARFGNDERLEWGAICDAARRIAEAIEVDFLECGDWPTHPRFLIVAGKGHNGADALLAAARLLERFPRAHATVVLVPGPRALRPLTSRALHQLTAGAASRIEVRSATALGPVPCFDEADLLIDGLFGMRFRSPMEADCTALVRALNGTRIRMRAAVDLPSGLLANNAETDPVVRADFTYATGIVKEPLLAPSSAAVRGRIRALDLGFFPPAPPGSQGTYASHDHIALPAQLASLQGLRPSGLDKVRAGHVLIVAGSSRYPGTAMLATLGALHGGAGLVTTCLPASLHATFAAQTPEAMWTALPETENGGLALESLGLLLPHLAKAHAVVVGPGLGREAETTALVAEITRRTEAPLILDADALMPEVIAHLLGRRHPTVLTPHQGEWKRIARPLAVEAGIPEEDATPAHILEQTRAALTLLLKGNPSSLHQRGFPRLFLPHGGPVLARGGHGDLLAGLLGAILADRNHARDPRHAVAAGVTWAGLAAESLARARGQRAAPATTLLDHLALVLRRFH